MKSSLGKLLELSVHPAARARKHRFMQRRGRDSTSTTRHRGKQGRSPDVRGNRTAVLSTCLRDIDVFETKRVTPDGLEGPQSVSKPYSFRPRGNVNHSTETGPNSRSPRILCAANQQPLGASDKTSHLRQSTPSTKGLPETKAPRSSIRQSRRLCRNSMTRTGLNSRCERRTS